MTILDGDKNLKLHQIKSNLVNGYGPLTVQIKV